MPRRYVDYPEAFAYWNKISRSATRSPPVGVVVFLVMLVEMFLVRRKAGANPWGEGATTLEWTLSSPPPFHQFNELPVIKPEAACTERRDRDARRSDVWLRSCAPRAPAPATMSRC